MGSTVSRLSIAEVEEIQKECPQFSVRTIKKLFYRFSEIDREHRGTIGKAEIMKIPEFVMNPLRDRLLEIFPATNSRTNFKQFCQGISVFHPDATVHEKLKFLFRLYDVNGDEKVDKEDIEALLKMATGKALDDENRSELADSVLKGEKEYDFNGFCSLFPNDEVVIKKLSFSFEDQ